MNRFLLILLSTLQFLLISNLYCQETEIKEFPANSVQFEASAFVVSYSFIYNRVLNTSKRSKPFFGLGAQYFPHFITGKNVYTIVPQIGFLYGNKNHIEASVGASLDLVNREQLFPIYLGYRYHSPKDFFVFKAGFSMIYSGTNHSDTFFDSPFLLPLPTIGLGLVW